MNLRNPIKDCRRSYLFYESAFHRTRHDRFDEYTEKEIMSVHCMQEDKKRNIILDINT